MLSPSLTRKRDHAVSLIRKLDGAVVAFSGGVDSTLLLRMAHEALGERCLALTAVSASLPERERRDAQALAAEIGVAHRWVESDEVSHEDFARNPTNRCYFCKSELFDLAFVVRDELGWEGVLYGATADDAGDHRPGMAAARERGALAPLLEADLGKDEIRAVSRDYGLRTWNKPAMACLASRFPYGTPIDDRRLGQVERAEAVLVEQGFREFRVRFHEDIARLELGAGEWSRLLDPETRAQVEAGIRAAGFTYVAMDLAPFRSGRLNEALLVDSPDAD